MKTYKVTFDGCGLNDETSEYKHRLMTLNDFNSGKEFGKFAERAVNSHEELLAALKAITFAFGEHLIDEAHEKKVNISDLCPCANGILKKAEQAIAKVEGKI